MIEQSQTNLSRLADIAWGVRTIPIASLGKYEPIHTRIRKLSSAWARENLLVSGELEEYEDRLEDEWARYRDVVFETLDQESAESIMREAGQRLYQWADLESGNISTLRIRERVTEPYVVRGGFHILANTTPIPRIYWHPLFLKRLSELLAVTA
jgi:hypothetical protein